MRSLRLKNFRSLGDTGRVELRPLTVLVGANSSGKSSFLRFFPLLRQTLEKPTASPLLWNGRYADFGSFSQTVNSRASEQEITIEFEEVLPAMSAYTADTPWVVPLCVTSSTTLRDREGVTSTTSYAISSTLDERVDVCTLEFKPSGELKEIVAKSAVWGPWRYSDIEGDALGALVPTLKGGIIRRGPRLRPFAAEVEHRLMNLVGNKLTPENVEFLARGLAYGPCKEVLKSLENARGVGGATLSRMLDQDRRVFNRLMTLVFAGILPAVLHHLRAAVEKYAAGVAYIGPFRVDPERYYRVQDEFVNFIEPGGRNLAMFLRSLSPDHLARFSAFVHDHFGLRVRLAVETGHVSILLEDDVKGAFNLIDLGYGFSQVLPIVAQCWAAANGRRATPRDPLPTLIAVEQPELHLHPHYQAKLADMFASTLHAAHAAVPEETPKLLIETHSDALVNRLGELVESGKLATEDVIVLLFEQDPVTKITSVRQSTFAPDGTLTNWPIGFFAP